VPSRRRLLVEVACAYVVSVAATAALYRLALASSTFEPHLHSVVGALFLVIPLIALKWLSKESLDDYGVPPVPLLREVGFACLVALIVFPPFYVLTRLWWWWLGWGHPHLEMSLPPGLIGAAIGNVVVVALPEEFFYRGYLMTRLDRVLPPKMTVLRAKLGWSLPLTALMFGLGHYLVTFGPERLAVAIPALVFGWMRVRRGHIASAVIFHALCNILMEVLLHVHGIAPPPP